MKSQGLEDYLSPKTRLPSNDSPNDGLFLEGIRLNDNPGVRSQCVQNDLISCLPSDNHSRYRDRNKNKNGKK
jgi:ribosomal protein S12